MVEVLSSKEIQYINIVYILFLMTTTAATSDGEWKTKWIRKKERRETCAQSVNLNNVLHFELGQGPNSI